MASSILSHARETPDRLATQSGTGSLTYAQLDEQARKAAHVLAKKGVSADSVVGIALRDGQQSLVAMLGVWLLGGTCNLIDIRTSAEERKSLSETYHHVLVLEDRTRPGNSYPGLSLGDWADELAAAPLAQVAPPENAGPAYLAFTSGTTGAPATMKLSHDAMLFASASLREAVTGHFYQRYLSTAPMSYGGSAPWVTDTLIDGGTVFFFPIVFRPRDLVEAFEKHGITGCTMVPTVLRDLLDHVRDSGKPLATSDTPLWLATHGAAIQTPELMSIRALLTPYVVQVYACHPVGPVTFLDLNKEPTKIETVGRPLRGVQVEIVDQAGQPLPAMTVGQVRINSPRRAISLEGRNRETGSDYFLGDWYYPGDIGLIDADGYLKLAGRSTDVIIRGGVNVYPQEVEAALSDVPGIRRVAAIGYPDERVGEEIALFAVADPGISADDLQNFCKARLPATSRPKRILIVPKIPVNASGKVVKEELSRLLMPG